MPHITDPILEVGLNDDFNTGREKWNANDVNLETRIDSLHLFQNTMFFENKVFTDGEELSNGWKFPLDFVDEPSSAHLTNGSVLVLINGLYYLSRTNQLDGAFTPGAPPVDFHIGTRDVTIHNTQMGGSINLQDGDQIGIYFQKE